MTNNTEQDIRLNMLNTLLKTPHRDLSSSYEVHQNMISEDPMFYSHLAAWYSQNGDIRDHKELFVINLCLSSFEGHRDIGLSLMREMPPFQVARVIRFIKGHTIKTVTDTGAAAVRGRARRKTSVEKKIGLFKNDIPRSMRTELRWYLEERENSEDWFDSSVAVARKYMKSFYKIAKIYPFTERAQNILFKDAPPEGSRLHVIKNLNKTTDPVKQAKFIIENKVPYRIAATVIKQMTPTVLLALIEVMSDQELINNIGSLKRRGVFQNEDLKNLVNERLKKAKKSKKVAGLKSLEAVKAANVTGEIADTLKEVADSQIKAKGRIKVPTALLVDKSQSMSSAIELGKHMASIISTVAEDDFYCYVFDSMPRQITSKGETLADWEKAFAGTRAGGSTSLGSPLVMMEKLNQRVEQIMLITDEGEVTPPAFLKSYQSYSKKMNVEPSVFILRTGSYKSKQVFDKLVRAGVDVQDYELDATDYYALPGLVQYLTKGSKLDFLMEVLSTPIPERKFGVDKKELQTA